MILVCFMRFRNRVEVFIWNFHTNILMMRYEKILCIWIDEAFVGSKS